MQRASGNLSMQTDACTLFLMDQYSRATVWHTICRALSFAERHNKLTGTRPQVYGILTHKTTDEGVASVYLAVTGSEAAGGARGSARMPPTASIARTEM